MAVDLVELAVLLIKVCFQCGKLKSPRRLAWLGILASCSSSEQSRDWPKLPLKPIRLRPRTGLRSQTPAGVSSK